VVGYPASGSKDTQMPTQKHQAFDPVIGGQTDVAISQVIHDWAANTASEMT